MFKILMTMRRAYLITVKVGNQCRKQIVDGRGRRIKVVNANYWHYGVPSGLNRYSGAAGADNARSRSTAPCSLISSNTAASLA